MPLENGAPTWEELRPGPAIGGRGIQPGPTAREPSGLEPKKAPTVWDTILNKTDQALLELGVLDKSTYRGRGDVDPNAQPTLSNPAPRAWWERMGDSYDDATSLAGQGETGAGGRALADAFNLNDAFQAAQNPGSTAAQREAYRDAQMRDQVLEQRDVIAMREAADPAWQEGGSFMGNVGRVAAGMGGDLAGNANPTYLIGGPGRLLQRMLTQGGINAGIDVGIQGVEMGQGIQDEFDPLRAGGQFAAGAGFELGGSLARGAWRAWRGVPNEPGAPLETPDDLMDVTLDGGPGGPGGAPDVVETLASVGMRPEQFSTPDLAAAMASRVAAARARVPNVEPSILRERADLEESIAAGETDPSFAPPPLAPRVVPGDVTMQAHPEGTIRSDEVGSLIGLMRNLAGNENVLEQAAARAKDNPALQAILDAQTSTQAKIGPLWERLAQMQRQQPPVPETLGRDPATDLPPQLRPTVEQARGETEGVVLPVAGGRVSSRFGKRNAPTKGASTDHGGIDIAAPRGTAVAAPEGGTVVAAGEAGANGNLVRIDHGNGVVTSYAHLDGINVKIGQKIGKGEQLGTVGSTGRSTGNHLHYAVTENGKRVDPETYRFQPRPAEEPTWRVGDQGDDIFDQAQGPAERMNRRASPSLAEMEEGRIPPGYEFPMGTSGNRPFKDVTPEQDRPEFRGPEGAGPPPEGTPPRAGTSFFEDRNQQQMDEMLREYEASQSRRRERQQRERASNAERDPSQSYKKYGQRPHQEGEFWRTTDDGMVADKDGNPVAFRSAKEAAKWATANKMAGDFELHSWGTNSERVVLKKRAQSTYGTKPEPEPRPDETRSPDGSPRAIEAPRSEDSSPPDVASEQASSPNLRAGDAEPAPSSGNLLDQSIAEVDAADVATMDSQRKADLAEYLQSVVDDPLTPEGGARAKAALDKLNAADEGPVVPTREPLKGEKETVVTPAGREVETEFEVRELADVRQAKGIRQPRDRGRAASDVQVTEIAAKLDPEQLGSNRQAAHGAPIIGPDGVIEVGNGRMRALERAYSQHPERAEAYRKMIAGKGFDVEGFERPVLVRKRLTEMGDDDLRAWVNEAQDSGTMRYSAPEQAKADAGAVKDDTLELYRGGDINSAGNRDFVKAWMADTGADKNSVLASDGTLSLEGQNRARASILARAFDDDTLVSKLLGDSDNNIKAIGVALTDLAPKFAQVKAMAAEGRIKGEFDISGAVAKMAGLISRSRAEGKKLADLVGQKDMFGGDVDALTETLVRLMFKDEELAKPRAGVRLKEGFDFYLEGAKRTEEGPGMFADEAGELTPVDILEAARTKLDAKDNPPGQGTMFKVISERERKALEGLSNKSLKDELKRHRADADPEQRELIDRLLESVDDDARLTYGFLGDRGPGKMIAGQADSGANRVYVASSRDLETLLHETVHLALIRRYGDEFTELRPNDLGAGPAVDMIRLYNQARARYGKYGFWNRKAAGHTVEYALSSVDEFIAEALTSKAFQRWLQRGTIWNKLVDGFRKVLGLPARFKPMLDDVLRSGRQLLDAAPKDEASRAGVRSAPAFGRKGIAYKIVDKDGLTRDVERLRKAVGDPGKVLQSLGRRIKDGVAWTMFSNDARGRMVADRIESEAAHELLDHFMARAGRLDDDAVGRTYHEAVQRYGSGRAQQAFRALEGITGNRASERRVAELLRFPNRKTKATAAELEAAKQLRTVLKETIDYRREAGEEIGEVADGYFPRWLDVDKVMERSDDFKKAAAKLYLNIGLDRKEAEAAAQRWLEHSIDTYAGLDAGLDLYNAAGDTVGARTAQARQFGKEADAILADFYQDDVLPVLAQYFHGSARRAEMARRFGKKGAVGSNERKKWEEEHGDKTQLDVLEDRIREDARNHGGDGAGAMGVLRSIYSANLGRLAAGMSARQRQTVAWAHTWTQLGVMDRAVITSLAELMHGFTRGGARSGLPFIRESMKQYVRQLRRAAPDDAQRWTEALGIAQDALVNEALTARASIEGGTQKSQKVLQGFYQGTTLHQYTEATRIASVKMARELIRQWSHDMVSKTGRVSSRAKKYLAEVGIKDPEAFAKSIREGGFELEDVAKETSGGAREYATAVIRIANQTIMRPTRAEKPVWANHPVGSMFFSLMSYAYGFKKQVLDRAGRLAVHAWKDKDPTLLLPAMGLAMTTAWQGLLDTYLRPAVFGGGPPEDETAPQAALRIVDRAGLTGGLSPIVNALTGVRYRRALAESLLGPVIGRPLDMGTKFVELGVNNSPNTNTAERNAAGAVYDNLVEPAIDGAAAARLLGAARTGAIMGTGTRGDDGMLPSDREAFIEAIAGKKKGG